MYGGNVSFTVNGADADKNTAITSGDIICTKAAQAPEAIKDRRIINVCINEEWHEIAARGGEPLLFVDMLNYVEVDTKNPQGELVLRINGKEARYIDSIGDGDRIEIGFLSR